MAIDRYVCMLHPHHYHKHASKKVCFSNVPAKRLILLFLSLFLYRFKIICFLKFYIYIYTKSTNYWIIDCVNNSINRSRDKNRWKKNERRWDRNDRDGKRIWYIDTILFLIWFTWFDSLSRQKRNFFITFHYFHYLLLFRESC